MFQENRFPPAIFLMGPTASGKTALALGLVDRLPCEIISVDSVMIYRGMDIGTAKPSPAELRRAPHRLIDIRDPADSYSAAQFREDALKEMASIIAQGRIPLLVGGTMLYFRALEQGLSDLPAANPGVRARIEAQAAEYGWAALHDRLLRVDPVAGQRIHPNDPQRIQRALEVFELTGRPLSELCAKDRAQSLAYRPIKLAVAPRDRALLHRRIEQRFRRMLDEGLVEEVERLYRRGDLRAQLPAIRAVGYRQVWEYLAEQRVYKEMISRAIAATRQLAKRQLTWLRGETGLISFDSESNDIRDQVFRSASSLVRGHRASDRS